MRIYIESTIPSYLVARPARDLLQAARQQLTRDWGDLQREQHELFSSQLVLDEMARGESEMAKRRHELLANVALLESTEEARDLTRSIVDSGLLPAKAEGDAAHIALATVHGMDILLTWNCRHIANAAIVGRLRKLVAKQGHTLPEIYTPEELIGA
jgi:hypothetical protein